MYKMVFLDIDGTILNSQGLLDEKISKSLGKLSKKGILIGLATGRSPTGAKIYGNLLGIDYLVTYNGALVIANEKIIFDKQLPAEVAQKLCEKAATLGGTYFHFQYNVSRSNHPNHYLEHLLPKAIFSLPSNLNIGAHRITLYLDILNKNKLLSDRSVMIETLTFDEHDRLEIYPLRASKWEGIQQIIRKIRIKPEEVVTIGDGTNDIDMLKFSGLGVAMGNATKSAKKVAKWVTETNDNHGVYYALNEIFDLKY